jgi:anti-anti-sigma factor
VPDHQSSKEEQDLARIGLSRFLDIRIHTPLPKVTVVRISGELDMLTVPLMAERVREQISRSSHVVVDFDRVGFMGSCCLTAMVDLHKQAAAQDVQLHWAGATSPAVMRPLEATGLLHALSVHSVPADEVVAHLRLRYLLQEGASATPPRRNPYLIR